MGWWTGGFLGFSVVALAAAGSSAPGMQESDLREAVLRHASRHREEARKYRYLETVTDYDLRGKEPRPPGPSRTHEVFPIGAFLYKRLVRIGNRPLRERMARKEWVRESAFRRRARSDPDPDKSRGRREIRIEDLIDRYEYRVQGEEWIDGRQTLVVAFHPGDWSGPSPGRLESIFHNLEGTVWIDGEDYQVVRFRGRLTQNFRWGLGLIATLNRFELEVEQGMVDQRVWLPSRVTYTAEGTTFILGRYRRMRVSRFHDFRKIDDLAGTPGSVRKGDSEEKR